MLTLTHAAAAAACEGKQPKSRLREPERTHEDAKALDEIEIERDPPSKDEAK
jgi:hypothetical protein